MGPLPLALALLLAAGPARAAGCEVPEDGSSPLRRVVAKVRYLAETEAWEREASKNATVQFALRLDAPLQRGKHCYWPVEARAGGELWQRFYVTALGDRVLVDTGGKLVTLEDWRKLRR